MAQPTSFTSADDMEIARIARRYLGIETLEVRNSDRLDFHDVGVAGLKAALIAAFHAGRASVAS